MDDCAVLCVSAFSRCDVSVASARTATQASVQVVALDFLRSDIRLPADLFVRSRRGSAIWKCVCLHSFLRSYWRRPDPVSLSFVWPPLPLTDLARETYLKWQEQLAFKEQGSVPASGIDALTGINQYTCKLWRGQRNCYATAWALTSWW